MKKRRWLGALLGGLLAAGAPARADEPILFPPMTGQACPVPVWAEDCGPPAARFWGRAEYLLWWIQGADVPPLITTGTVNPADPADRPGELGRPDTRLLLGDETLDSGPLSGGRFTLGGWLDAEQRLGLEGGYLFLGEESLRRSLAAPGTPGSTALTLPFFNPVTGLEDSTGVAIPTGTGFSGVADLSLTTRLQAAELNALFNVRDRGELRLDLLAGYRHFRLDESLVFATDSTNVPPLPPDVFLTSDQFHSDNEFHGGQLGARAAWRRGTWRLEAAGKVALGIMRRGTTVGGSLLTNDFTGFGAVQAFPGGYFAQPTNRGTFTDDGFAVVPEASLRAGWQPRDWLRLSVGYTFLYAGDVARPADQIDRVINSSQGPGFTGDPNSTLVGLARPQFPGRETGFWAHGLSFGVGLRYGGVLRRYAPGPRPARHAICTNDPLPWHKGFLEGAIMQVLVNTNNHLEGKDELSRQVEAEVDAAVGRFGDRITRVEVFLGDVNSENKGGVDKRCLMEARVGGLQPVVASHLAGTLEEAISGAAERLEKALDSTLGRLSDHKGRTSFGGDQTI